MIVGRVLVYLSVRFYVAFVKGIVWRAFPDLVRRYYARRRRGHDSIVLLIHEGLGDLASLVSAIHELAKEHRQIHVVTQKDHFDAIVRVFGFPENVTNIPALEGKAKNYRVSREYLARYKSFGKVIKVGKYESDPVFGYPDSFYVKLGLDPALGEKTFPYSFEELRTRELDEFLAGVGERFVFFSNETTQGAVGSPYFESLAQDEQIVAYSLDARLLGLRRVHDIARLNKGDFCRSLLNSLYACHRARMVIVSDAGLFNVLIRLKNTMDIRVMWRKHPHSLNRQLYGKYLSTIFVR